MATIKAFIRTTKNVSIPSNVRFRLSDGRAKQGGIQAFYKSSLQLPLNKWDSKQQQIKARCVMDEQKRSEFNAAIANYKELIMSIYLKFGEKLTSELLEVEMNNALDPKKTENNDTNQDDFFNLFTHFLENRPLSRVRYNNFMVLFRVLKRFEMYERLTNYKSSDFKLDINFITPDTLQDIATYLKNEHILYTSQKELFKSFPEYRENKPRGQNTINSFLTKLRTFMLWCVKLGYTQNKPFDFYKIGESVYGTPFYITIEERNAIYRYDFHDSPSLEIQRDIFIFQCLIGCRVGDLYKLTKANIINGEVNYIADKTKDKKPKTIKVPLNSIAQEIVEKYSSYTGKYLFPFISQQKYNVSIKKIFTKVGITRNVVICNSLTRENEIRPINEVASSHLARRCFVGNMYEKVKDQNLVAELSGHKQNSKAFARYREVNESMRKELVKLIE